MSESKTACCYSKIVNNIFRKKNIQQSLPYKIWGSTDGGKAQKLVILTKNQYVTISAYASVQLAGTHRLIATYPHHDPMLQ